MKLFHSNLKIHNEITMESTPKFNTPLNQNKRKIEEWREKEISPPLRVSKFQSAKLVFVLSLGLFI